ncbi:hypothetical protein HN51_058485 [Arachis hypogaea]|uniref:RING-type domain-containing protein n=2 Tax=Arachis TaxID=3817 RepID=A0A444X178_ARAHY|nr:RING-H2 finger protein ATL7-like [Arachis ipaensis]XP_025684075.1 RING-H2 finger protein ATL7 [Arachis hypogaea]XP_029145442.1 RING-H2 finger protein ATL7 [Arachis hypogaea]XP_052111444.1 RING-H2 finger protein ATL7 [Arachis duranensis]XP_057739140.1 RING-H2 finger protein ATL7-like [Arachis stenosperma]QHN81772.1 E3 ubiquitin-protein ligase RHA2A [Arachis hypogaea]QHO15642.1 E3 ubiquitin-protein ligase RHA2A [Arachis hypogaea]RYQ83474.1 hypothetical protein Ahy_B10g102159 [Arachis hypoga
MAIFSKLFHKLCYKIIILLAFLLTEIIILIRKLKSSSYTGPITTKKYLRFIEEKNPTICYSKKSSKLLKLKPPRHVECTLCLSEFMEGEKLRSLKCQHTFHRDCLDTWLKDYCATCPLCRLKVVSDDVVSQHRELRKQADSNGNGEQLTYFLAVLRGGNTLQS